MRSRNLLIGAALGVAGAASSLNADITGAYCEGRYVSATDFAGQPDFNGYVIDLWLQSDDPTDTNLNVHNVNIENSLGDVYYYQSFTGYGWTPNNLGHPFETEALKHADSFVSCGGRNADLSPAYGCNDRIVQMSANGTGLDPNFGGNNADRPGADAGWYNSNRENYIGSPVDGVVFIGRFALQGVEQFEISGNVGVAWNNGIGTEGAQAVFGIYPWRCSQGEGVFDCNGNGVIDSCEIDELTDCNANGIPDECDLADGTSEDVDGDGLPDECLDCNTNGIGDFEDIANGTSEDCNGNQVPDECELPTSVFTASETTIPTAKSPLEISCPTDALAVTDTLIEVMSTGDFGSIAEFLIVSLNGEAVGYLFSSDGGDCTEATGVIAIDPDQWNTAGRKNAPLISIAASPAVDPSECASSAIDVVVTVGTGYPDCNENGVWDTCDIAYGTSVDCNGNGRPDECEIEDIPDDDCNGNGIIDICELNETTDCNNNGQLDTCDLAESTALDCNDNGVPDSCDIDSGASNDVDSNGIPDECKNDCNGNGIPDYWEILQGLAEDCNANNVPDECDIAGGTATDLDGNGVPDTCDPDCDNDGEPDAYELSSGQDVDCNENLVPDECDITDSTSNDVDSNAVPDECQDDCNGNGVPDTWEIAQGLTPDCNGNQVPDSCDIADGKLDDNDNGIPDSCDLARGDLDLDGCVGGGDLGVLLSFWGFTDPPIGDLDGDGVISGGDLGILLLNWERCP